MSQIMISLAQHALAQPAEATSREGVAAAVLLASVAWNRALGYYHNARSGEYLKVLRTIKRDNPDCLEELKSKDLEAIIAELIRLKGARYPSDNRFIRACGLTEQNNVRVVCDVPAAHARKE